MAIREEKNDDDHLAKFISQKVHVINFPSASIHALIYDHCNDPASNHKHFEINEQKRFKKKDLLEKFMCSILLQTCVRFFYIDKIGNNFRVFINLSCTR